MRKSFILLVISLAFAVDGAEKFVEGKIGMALEGRHAFPASVFSPGQGTFQCWFKPYCSPQEMHSSMLLSIGPNAPGWIFCMFNRGNLQISFKTEKGFDGGKLKNLEMSPGKWHHIAFSWGKYKGKTFLNLYLDGALKLHRENLRLPEKLSGDTFGLGYNTAYYAAPDFPGAMDEVAVYSIPLDAGTVHAAYQRGMNGNALEPGAGCTFYASLDGSFEFTKGQEADERLTRQMLRRSSRDTRIMKYSDELDFSYRIDQIVTEKGTNALQDANESTFVFWKDTPREIICELPHTSDLRLIEIAAPKFTKWYMLEELHISIDNGSGEFGSPRIIPAYSSQKNVQAAPGKDTGSYYYTFENPGRAARVKIRASGKAYMALSEIRICGKIAQ